MKIPQLRLHLMVLPMKTSDSFLALSAFKIDRTCASRIESEAGHLCSYNTRQGSGRYRIMVFQIFTWWGVLQGGDRETDQATCAWMSVYEGNVHSNAEIKDRSHEHATIDHSHTEEQSLMLEQVNLRESTGTHRVKIPSRM